MGVTWSLWIGTPAVSRRALDMSRRVRDTENVGTDGMGYLVICPRCGRGFLAAGAWLCPRCDLRPAR